jgi:hydroxymethylbilane synthase
MTVLRLGTRGSKLALAQSRMVAEMLESRHSQLGVELVEIRTEGDRDQSTPLAEGVGWFTTAIQEALQRNEVDLAVHSYKDLPTQRPEGLVIAAVPVREDPRDALVSRGGKPLRELPAGAVLGTSSPRREAQVRAMRPDLEIRLIRGNVDTRLAKVEGGDYDATILALAGLKRLALDHRVTQVFAFDEMLPAPAQGAIAVECRAADETARAVLAAIDDPALRREVAAERSFLATLEAGCSFPAAAHAEHFGTTLKLAALVAPEGRVVRARTAGPADTAVALGKALADELMQATGITPGQR